MTVMHVQINPCTLVWIVLLICFALTSIYSYLSIYHSPLTSHLVPSSPQKDALYNEAVDRYLTLMEGVVTTSLFPDLGGCDGWNNCNGRWPFKAEDLMMELPGLCTICTNLFPWEAL